MPPNRTRSDPGPEPKTMSWGKAIPILVVCVVFDALRLMFEWFGIFGPALVGTAAGAWLSQYIGSWLGTLLGTAVAAGTGFFLFAAFETFGAVMAMAVGFAGWLTLALLLVLFNRRIFKANESALLWMLAGFVVSEIPIIGSVPSLTVTAWRLYHRQIKVEKAEHKRWKDAHDRLMKEERESATAELVARRRVQIAQAEAANDNAAPHSAVNDNEEIPEETRAAA